MVWFAAGVFVFTALSFWAAIITSQIIAAVSGTPVQGALEERCKRRSFNLDSLFGYHPLNQQLWFVIAGYPAMPPALLSKQRTLRVVVGLLLLVFLTLLMAMLILAWRSTT